MTRSKCTANHSRKHLSHENPLWLTDVFVTIQRSDPICRPMTACAPHYAPHLTPSTHFVLVHAAAGDAGERDALEAAALYELLEHRVATRYYERDADGVPVEWVRRVRQTLATLVPQLGADRMVRQYVEELYQIQPPRNSNGTWK